MSSDLAVRMRGVSKRYRIRSDSAESNAWTRRRKEWFTALDNIDLDIPNGTVLGVIGHNGSGKSTLLKIVCRITAIDAGEVDVWGRIGSLLEVGTGFHGELSGRENVYLNGSILGMRKREIDQEFANIVDFASIGPFLDTPVKRYSSGMRVRLAFAVAAHLRPEILVVDEVLAVGDAEFQRRCLGKMHDVAAEQGRTVLFVSHNMAAIDQLCSRVVVLNRGALVADAAPAEAIRRYLSSGLASTSGSRGEHLIDGVFVSRVTTMSNQQGTEWIRSGDPLSIVIDLKDFGAVRSPDFAVGVFDQNEALVFSARSRMRQLAFETRSRDGSERVELCIPHVPLVPGTYRISVKVRETGSDALHETIVEAAKFEVVGGANVFGTGYDLTHADGIVYVDHDWLVRSDELVPQAESKEV